jgi:gamma-glutamylcyclotransferase (GGCT)/AIG2-like uncharacterized protein YtfP
MVCWEAREELNSSTSSYVDDRMYYFAYGSNLNRKQMLRRCPDAKPKFRATLPDHKLVFAGRSREWSDGGIASIRPCIGEEVAGALYEISEECRMSLDRYEGYPDMYDRITVTIVAESDKPVEAMTYIMVRQSDETQPAQEYLDTIQDGYKDWGIASGLR